VNFSHAKQLIEDTIRRNASPVREHEMAVGGPLTGSSSSINSSASDDSALPSSARASRALMHSLSTNDANIGEYKYSVVTGGYTIKITGDNLDLVRVSGEWRSRRSATVDVPVVDEQIGLGGVLLRGTDPRTVLQF
jgi:hypothetical protein